MTFLLPPGIKGLKFCKSLIFNASSSELLVEHNDGDKMTSLNTNERINEEFKKNLRQSLKNTIRRINSKPMIGYCKHIGLMTPELGKCNVLKPGKTIF